MTRSDDDKNPASPALAVALGHTPGSETAPKILASGNGAVAEQIVRLALDNGVRVREDADLASILSVLEVESIVPVEVFATISEILSYLYRANGMTEEQVAEAVNAENWYRDLTAENDDSAASDDGRDTGDVDSPWSHEF
jgi:flagellar biosynthesis protein